MSEESTEVGNGASGQSSAREGSGRERIDRLRESWERRRETWSESLNGLLAQFQNGDGDPAAAGVAPSNAGSPGAGALEELAPPQVPPRLDGSLRFLTWNLAHGRRQASHQALLKTDTLRQNLHSIAVTLKAAEPDVVALQEVDGPSPWSGNFDHLATLAELGELADHFLGEHNPFGLGSLRLRSGTALMSQRPLGDPESHRFNASWRDTKGFVVATLPVPEWEDLEIDVVSVHLDFLMPRIRKRQVHQMAEALADRNRPLVVLGDLNACWQLESRTLSHLAQALGLNLHAPEQRAPTYPAHRPWRRLDWILVSRELEFHHYQTVDVPLSDHLGVMADLVLK